MIQMGRVGVEIPVSYKEIERLVAEATNEIDVKGDKAGFYQQTIETIANATFLQKGGDFWLIWDDESKLALGFIVGYISKDIDNKITYWCTLAYAAKQIRRQKQVKQLWQLVRETAKQKFCKHILVVSSRNNEAYCRFLGENWHEYATILKEDI